MDTVAIEADLMRRFAPVVSSTSADAFLSGETLASLTLAEAPPLSVVWAPFDHMPSTARLVIVGIMPGRQQAENALRAFRDALRSGAVLSEAGRRAKLTGSVSGPLRANLVSMLDHIGAHRALGVRGCLELFDPAREIVHFTSALRYPVFVAGQNYNGAPDMLTNPTLRRMVESLLAAEAQALPNALWLPLGPKPAAALRHLVRLGILDAARVLDGLPHPSGANAERIAYFLGRKARETLSAKTNAQSIDAARDALRAQIMQLTGEKA
jgi:hypothetical protein